MTDQPNIPGLQLHPDGGWAYSDRPDPDATTMLPRIPAELADPPEDWNTGLDELPAGGSPTPWAYEVAGRASVPIDEVMAVLDAVDEMTGLEAPPTRLGRVWNRCWQGAMVATVALWSGFLGTMTAHEVAQLTGWWQ